MIESLASLFQDSQAFIVDWSPIAEHLAPFVDAHLNCTIITNSPAVALSFSRHSKIEVRVIGGRMTNGSVVPITSGEVEFLTGLRPQLAVLGSCYVDLNAGITTSDSEVAANLKQLMIANASQVVAVLPSNSLGKAGKYVIGTIDRLTHLAIYDENHGEALSDFTRRGIEIVGVNAPQG